MGHTYLHTHQRVSHSHSHGKELYVGVNITCCGTITAQCSKINLSTKCQRSRHSHSHGQELYVGEDVTRIFQSRYNDQTYLCNKVSTFMWFPVSKEMYPVDTVNCFPVLPKETLVVGHVGQKAAHLAEDTDRTYDTTIIVVGVRRVNRNKKENLPLAVSS